MKKTESWRSYDDFLLYGTLDRYSKLLARYELYKLIVDIPGDIIECGVFQGGGILYWARLIQIFNPLSRRKVVGFDTFSGYPDSINGEHDRKAIDSFLEKSQYDPVSPENIMEHAASLELESRIQLIKGDATEAIKNYVKKHPGFRAALINLDFDVYEPTFAALNELFPLLVPNGVVVFDEYAIDEWGESNAIDEYFADKKVNYKTFPWGFSPTAYLIKES
jgi:cephalosporin hydroxylase